MSVDPKNLSARVSARRRVRHDLKRKAKASIIEPCLIFLEQFEPEEQEAILTAGKCSIATADDGSSMTITLELKRDAET